MMAIVLLSAKMQASGPKKMKEVSSRFETHLQELVVVEGGRRHGNMCALCYVLATAG